MISPASVQEVMNRADIVEVVGSFVRLKRRGSNYIANCPFHNEKTPSFSVSATKGIFKCFGCGKGGNVVNFVMEHEKLPYVDGIRWLADFYKIALEETAQSPEQVVQRQTEESLRVLVEAAAQYFEQTLTGTEEGQAIGLSYFKERGLRAETIRTFRLGYSPEGGSAMYAALTAAGFSKEMLEKAGLIKDRNGVVYDAYRGRVVFPIQTVTGRVIGFGARILKSNDKAPKYVNSPESELYNKSKSLYGIHQARAALGKLDECYLVEGYLDVISMHQAGVTNTVASSGTSLTEDQLRAIGQLTRNLTILYDGDAAGIKAALRGLDLALGQGFSVKVLLLPDGDDPDSFIKKNGRAAFEQYAKEKRQDVIGFRLRVGLQEAGDDPAKKSRFVQEIAETISRINKAEDFALQQHYIREAVRGLGVDEAGFITLVNKYIRERIEAEGRNKRRDDRSDALQPPVEPDGEPVDLSSTLTADSVQEPQEWELIRVLTEWGTRPYEGYANVAALIRDRTDPELLNVPLVRRMWDDYFESLDVTGNTPGADLFTMHPDPAIQQMAATLLHRREDISPNWSAVYGIETPQGEVAYVDDVESTLSYFELKKIKLMQAELSEHMPTEKDPARIRAMQNLHMKLKADEKEALKRAGAVIIRMR